ncbi:MAG: DUF2817 domain-containing protein [Tropicimonas sp.]|uniref:DUF2817 domain-containing protein n=1 Tax=Tropicimonas sp. TaxID=2067044 RepID=UPI003A8A94B6
MTNGHPDFHDLYRRLREDFIRIAGGRGWTLSGEAHPLSGREGEHYGVDIARFGPERARFVLFVLSGVHGTELEAGSIAQQDLMRDAPAALPADCAIVMVHAVNPHGCFHLSRTDEDNIDPNRNLRADLVQAPRNAAYDALHPVLCPQSWDAAARRVSDDGIAAFVARNGMRALTQDVLKGQYDHPDGLFYGGRQAGWSVRRLQALLETHGKGAERIAVLDIHTGVGPKGWGELIRLDRPAVGGAEWSEIGGCVCDLADRVETAAPAIKIIVEFGTRDFPQVLDALRADNWLRHHGTAGSAQAAAIKADLYRALICGSPEWRAGVIGQTRAAAEAILRELRGERSTADEAADAFGQALSAARRPGEAFQALQTLAQAVIGARLFTIMAVSEGGRAGQRVYSNQPGAYPVSGIIPLKDNAWYDTAIRRQAPFVANDAAGLAAVFADHGLIASLGCASVLNLPVTLDGVLGATINLLDEAGHFTPERVALAQRVLSEPARAALRAEEHLRREQPAAPQRTHESDQEKEKT